MDDKLQQSSFEARVVKITSNSCKTKRDVLKLNFYCRIYEFLCSIEEN